MASTNLGLALRVEETSIESAQQVTVLNVAHEVLDALPIGVLGIGDEGLIAIANQVARQALEAQSPLPLVGSMASERLPTELLACLEQAQRESHAVSMTMDSGALGVWEIRSSRIGVASAGNGFVLVMIPVSVR